MSAVLRITAPDAAPRTFAIEVPVLRIGSSGDSDLVLTGIEPHAITLQYRDRAYRLFNRTARAVLLGPRLLGPGQSTVWPPRQKLRLVDGTLLELRLDRDPAPRPRRWQPMEDQEADERAAGAGDAAVDRRKTMEWAIIVVCVLGMVMVSISGPPPGDVSAEFGNLIMQWQAPGAPETPAREISDRLRSARRKELREDFRGALNEYTTIRASLQQGLAAEGEAGRHLDRETLEFVQQRIARLELLAQNAVGR